MHYTSLSAVSAASLALLAGSNPLNNEADAPAANSVCFGRLEFLVPKSSEVYGCLTWDAQYMARLNNPAFPAEFGIYGVFDEGPEARVYLGSRRGRNKLCSLNLEESPFGSKQPAQLPRFRCAETPPPTSSNIVWVPMDSKSGFKGRIESRTPSYQYFAVSLFSGRGANAVYGAVEASDDSPWIVCNPVASH